MNCEVCSLIQLRSHAEYLATNHPRQSARQRWERHSRDYAYRMEGRRHTCDMPLSAAVAYEETLKALGDFIGNI